MSITADFSYLQPMQEKPRTYLHQPPAGIERENARYASHACRVNDARQVRDTGLDVEGFRLLAERSEVADFLDWHEVRETYYRECADIVRRLTGARVAIVFDHLVRAREPGRPALGFGREGDGNKPAAVGRVHNDYTDASGRRRLGVQCPGMDGMSWEGRFAILNLWRPLVSEVLDTPLGICDARSVSQDDLVASDIHYKDRSGEIYLATHSPQHRWYYYPKMTRDEVLVFKSFDSAQDVARFTPHAAFDEPEIPPDAPLRRSIELRVLVIY